MKKEKNLIQFDDAKKKLKINDTYYNYNDLKSVKDFKKTKTIIIDNELKKSIINLFTGDFNDYDFIPYTQEEKTIFLELGIEIVIGDFSIKINLLENEEKEILLNTTPYYSYKNLLNFYSNKINNIILHSKKKQKSL